MPVPPIPSKSALLSVASTWAPTNASAMVDGGLSFDQKLDDSYYDAIKVAIRWKQLTGSAFWDTYLTSARTAFRDNYVIANNGGVVTWYAFSEGLALDWTVNANATSKSALAMIKNNQGYCRVGADQSLFQDIHYARENAYVLNVYLHNWEIGNDGTLDSRAATLKNNCFALFTRWKNSIGGRTQFYLRPFMVERVTETLFEYDRLIGLSQTEKDQIRDIWEYVHTTQYRPADAFPALNFTDRMLHTMDPHTPNTAEQTELVADNPTPQDGLVSGIDLTLLINHVYAKLYRWGYGDIWQTRHDAMFVPAIPVYDGFGNWVSGVYLNRNTIAAIKGKHLNQSLVLQTEAIADREAGPAASVPPLAGVGGYINMLLGLGCGGGTQITTTVVTGTIADSGSNPLAGVSVAMTGGATQTVSTNGSGVYTFTAITTGTIVTITPTLTGYTFSPANSGAITVAGTTQIQNFMSIQAYSPANAYTATPVLGWWKMYDPNFDLDASDVAQSTNGGNVKTAKDAYSGTPKNFIQATVGSQPVVATNSIATTKQTLTFNGKQMDSTAVDAAIRNLSKFALGAIVKLNTTSGNQFLFRCFEGSFSFNRILASINTGSPQLTINNTDGNTAVDVIDFATVLTTGVWHAILLLGDFTGNTVEIWVNGTRTKLATNVMASAGAMPNTAANQSRIGFNGNYGIADLHMASALPTPATWFAQVKSELGLTQY